jgi:hypothetical protein
MSRQRWVAAVAAMVLAGGLAGCSRSSASGAGRLEVGADGQAEISRPGQDRREITGSRNLTYGDRVRILRGTAVLRLPDNRRLELRLGTDVEIQGDQGSKDIRPTLIGGDLLVVSGDRPLPVTLSGAELAVQGDSRISRGVALLVAAYKGTAQLSAGGSTLTVPALRQAALPATGQFPTKVSPLEYSPTDVWDQRYLSDAIELSNELTARSQGFTAQLGAGEGRSATYFRDLIPRLAAEPGFTPALVNASRAPGETLVGATIALEGGRGTFAERWAAVFAFRDEGAPWGLVAFDQGVDRVRVLGTVEAAISSGPTQFAAGPPTRTPSSVALPTVGSPPTTSVPATTTPTTVRPRTGATTPTTTAPPTTSTTLVGPLNTGSPLIDDTVNSLVNTLTGLLRSLGGQ